MARRPWLVFLPGSDCSFYKASESRWIKALRSVAPYSVLVLNKVGVSENSCHQKEFNAGALRSARISAIESRLRSEVPIDAEILLIGESEGGYIAPDVARDDGRVRKVLLLSGGTKSWLEEEISFVPEAERPDLWNFFESEVIGSDDLDRFYNGWTYAQLNSYHNHKTYEALKALDIPVLLLNGEKDHNTWVAGTTEDFRQLNGPDGKTNLRQVIFPGADHGLHCSAKEPGTCNESALNAAMTSLVTDFAIR